MVKLLLKIGLNAVAIWVAVRFVDGLSVSDPDDVAQFVLLAIILGVINGLVRPVVKLLSLPAVLLTLGLFLLVINIAMFGLLVLLSDALGLGLDATGFGPIALGGLIVTVIVWVGELVVPGD